MIILILFAILLASFVLFKVISKSIAGRKRREAEERARREECYADLLPNDGEDSHLSIEERYRLELQESVASIAKDHPKNAALLIRGLMQEELASYEKSREPRELIMACQLIKTVGSDKARELLEKTLGSQKAIELINLLTRTVQG